MKTSTVLRRFARQVEQHLEQLQKGAAPPRHNRQLHAHESRQGASQVYVPGASASSSAVPLSSVQMPTPPTVSPPPIPTPKMRYPRRKIMLLCLLLMHNVGREPTLAQWWAKSEQEPSEWTLLIRKNGQREILL